MFLPREIDYHLRNSNRLFFQLGIALITKIMNGRTFPGGIFKCIFYFLYFNSNITQVCSCRSKSQYVSIGSGNGSLQWRHNCRDGVSNHQPDDCLLNRLLRSRSKKTLKPRITGLCAGNSPATDEFPAQRASNAENASIWCRHHSWRRTGRHL